MSKNKKRFLIILIISMIILASLVIITKSEEPLTGTISGTVYTLASYIDTHTHNGIDSKTLTISSVGIKTGSVSIISENEFVDVVHNINGIPLLLNVEPTNAYALNYYITNINSTSFRINIQNTQPSDATFIWSAGI